MSSKRVTFTVLKQQPAHQKQPVRPPVTRPDGPVENTYSPETAARPMITMESIKSVSIPFLKKGYEMGLDGHPNGITADTKPIDIVYNLSGAVISIVVVEHLKRWAKNFERLPDPRSDAGKILGAIINHPMAMDELKDIRERARGFTGGQIDCKNVKFAPYVQVIEDGKVKHHMEPTLESLATTLLEHLLHGDDINDDWEKLFKQFMDDILERNLTKHFQIRDMDRERREAGKKETHCRSVKIIRSVRGSKNDTVGLHRLSTAWSIDNLFNTINIAY